MLELHKNSNYLHRLTALFGIGLLADQIDVDTMRRQFLPVLQTMQKDPVANVRMNVAKSIS